MKTPIFQCTKTLKKPRKENSKQLLNQKHSKELNTLISGSTAGGFDVKDLRENTVLSGGYQAGNVGFVKLGNLDGREAWQFVWVNHSDLM